MRPHNLPDRLLVVGAAVLLLLVSVPTANAEGETTLPPPETEMGPGDVSDEPNFPGIEDNGFTDYSFTELASAPPKLVLDAHYLWGGTFPIDTDVNTVLSEATEGAVVEHEKHMYPPWAYFQAWWGWWYDKGSGARLNEEGQGTDEANRYIEDAHDNDSHWDDTRQFGPWDEFVWRGDNPWAEDHPMAQEFQGLVDIQSKPGDQMFLFIDPGTYQPHARQAPIPGNSNSAYVLRNDKDARDVPDMRYTDNTDQPAFRAGPFPQDGEWDLKNRRYTGTYDAGLMVTTTVTSTVNPAEKPGDAYDRLDGTAVDVDKYYAIHPQVEELYRMAVWDPHNEQESPTDPVHPEGPKQAVHDTFTPLWLNTEDTAIDLASSLVGPLEGHLGTADDAAGRQAQRHEPTHPDDQYGIDGDTPDDWATFDADTAYGDLTNQGNYYRPGDGQTYDGYKLQEHAWLDVQAGWGIPLYLFNFKMLGSFNLRPVESPNSMVGGDDRPGLPPGILSLGAHFGTWWDANGDNWVGNLSEPGRWTEPDDPYNKGFGDPTDTPDDPLYQTRGDDPNDYTDTPSKTQTDASKSDEGEWRPLCAGGGNIDATVTPKNPDESWGPGGVYVIRDSGDASNPYDDIVVDILGDSPAGDDPGERLSRHRTNGPIQVDFEECHDSETGLWLGDTWIVSPTGTITTPVTVEAQGNVQADRLARNSQGDSVQGEKIVDVDVLGSIQGD